MPWEAELAVHSTESRTWQSQGSSQLPSCPPSFFLFVFFGEGFFFLTSTDKNKEDAPFLFPTAESWRLRMTNFKEFPLSQIRTEPLPWPGVNGLKLPSAGVARVWLSIFTSNMLMMHLLFIKEKQTNTQDMCLNKQPNACSLCSQQGQPRKQCSAARAEVRLREHSLHLVLRASGASDREKRWGACMPLASKKVLEVSKRLVEIWKSYPLNLEVGSEQVVGRLGDPSLGSRWVSAFCGRSLLPCQGPQTLDF